jgi:hypothetical protein
VRAAWLGLALVACSDRFTSDVPGDASVDAEVDAGVDAGHDAHDAGACETVGRTGAADTCLLFAYCGHRHFEVDCAARFTCVCSEPDVDAGSTKTVAAEPIFCGSPTTDLGSAFAAARRACAF